MVAEELGLLLQRVNDAIKALEEVRADLQSRLASNGEPTAMLSRKKTLTMLGVNQAVLDQLRVFGVLPKPDGTRYSADAVLKAKEYLAEHPEISHPENHDRAWPEQALWEVITEPVTDPKDTSRLLQLCKQYGRRVGAIQSLKVCAQRVEQGDDRFQNASVTDAIRQIREIQTNHPDVPTWKKKLAARYDPVTCARPWEIVA